HSTEAFIKEFSAQAITGLPPFQGGCAGLLSYELGGCWEKLPTPELDEFKLPAAVIGVYDWVITWDHFQKKCWVIAHGFPEKDSAARHAKAKHTCDHLLERILSDELQHSQTRRDADLTSVHILSTENSLPENE